MHNCIWYGMGNASRFQGSVVSCIHACTRAEQSKGLALYGITDPYRMNSVPCLIERFKTARQNQS